METEALAAALEEGLSVTDTNVAPSTHTEEDDRKLLDVVLTALEDYETGLVVEAFLAMSGLDTAAIDRVQALMQDVIDSNGTHELAARREKLSKSGKRFSGDLHEFYRTVKTDRELINEAMRGLEDDEGYEVVRDDDFKIQYRNREGEEIHSLKCSVALDAPPWELMAICREWDLIPLWNSLMFDASKCTGSVLDSRPQTQTHTGLVHASQASSSYIHTPPPLPPNTHAHTI